MSQRYLLDTNVLIPYFTRDFFIELATRGTPSHWSVSIEGEFRRVWARLYPNNINGGAKILDLMHKAVPDWKAPERRDIQDKAKLPDPDDRHVLAAAVGIGAEVIVTSNAKDFPATILATYGVRALTPDEALCGILNEDTERFIAAASTMRARMTNPAMTRDEWLNAIGARGLKQLKIALQTYSRRI